MTGVPEGFSPARYARVAGALYLLLIVVGMWSVLFVRDAAIVSGDAAATARNIAASPSLWRAGVAADLVMHLCDVGIMVAIYVLLRVVHRYLALVVLLFHLTQTAVLVANKLALMIPIFLLGDAPYLKALTPEQLQALSYVFLRVHDYGFGFGLIFFGMGLLFEGHLIRRSGFLPAILGPAIQIAGVCYLVNSFALILDPALASKLYPPILVPAFLAELALALWLAIKGVDVARWEARARSAARPSLPGETIPER
jgi:hypothetical protein